MRRKRRGVVWDATIDAATSVGAIIQEGTSEDKPLVFLLPESDNTFTTRNFHPMQREIYEAMHSEKTLSTHEAKTSYTTRTPIFVLDSERSKFLHREESADETEEAAGVEEKVTPNRKSGKWTSEEKRIFAEVLEKHGQNWDLLADAVKTKTKSQIKNHFYDTRKPKARLEKRRKRRTEEVATPPPISTAPSESVQNTPVSEAPPPHMEAAMRHVEAAPPSYDNLPYHRLHQQHSLLGDSGLYLGQHRSQELEHPNQSRTSTPDHMDLAAIYQQRAIYQQNEEAARRLLQSHAQQQHLLRLAAQFGGGTEWNEQQLLLQHLQQQQQQQHHHHHQQQQQQQQHSNLAAVLGLSSGYGGVADDPHTYAQLLSLQQQQQSSGSSSSEAALHEYLRRLNGSGGGQGGGQR